MGSFLDLKERNHILFPSKNKNGKERLPFLTLFTSLENQRRVHIKQASVQWIIGGSSQPISTISQSRVK